MKIAIMGTSVTSGNRGVLALGAALINLCSRSSPDSEVVLLLGNRDDRPVAFRIGDEWRMIPVVHARLSPRSRLRDHLFWILAMAMLYRLLPFTQVRTSIARSTPWIKTVAETDLVGNVHGGDSFSDIYGLPRLVESFLMDLTVVLVKGSMVQFPQTYGPYKSPIARWLARFLLKRSSVIIARDKQSRTVAQNLLGPEKTVLLSPDVAFSLQSLRPATTELDPPGNGAIPSGLIGLNVNGLMYNGGYSGKNMFGLKLDYAAFLPQLVIALLKVHPGELWLIPHTFAANGNVESDPEASRKLRDALPPEFRARVQIVCHEYDQYEIKGVIGQCDFFIGSRMHACIAALSQGVPCIGVAYSMKFGGVFESVGMEDWVIDGRSVSTADAVARSIELYHRRHSVRSSLEQAALNARRQLTDIFSSLATNSSMKWESVSL